MAAARTPKMTWKRILREIVKVLVLVMSMVMLKIVKMVMMVRIRWLSRGIRVFLIYSIFWPKLSRTGLVVDVRG